MGIVKGLFALALVAGMAQGASAATYNFGGAAGDLGGSYVFTTAGAPSMTGIAGSAGVDNEGVPTLTRSVRGLGVNGRPDMQPDQIDGSPINSSEFITFNFGWAVRLVSFTLALVDRDDDYDLRVDVNNVIGTFTNSIVAHTNNAVGTNYVTSFRIRASGVRGQADRNGRDDFILASITVAPVPVPASVGLLAAALAGLGLFAARRRNIV